MNVLNSEEIYNCFVVLICVVLFFTYVFSFFKKIHNERYGLIHTWPMMPGGMTLTVEDLKSLQLKSKNDKKIL